MDLIEKGTRLTVHHNRIVVDWDGTCVASAWPAMGHWLPGAVEALHALLAAGFQVVVQSTRLACHEPDETTPRPEKQLEELEAVRAMLDEEELEAVAIWTNPWKPGALFYVDDLGIAFTSWGDVLERILGRTSTPCERAFNLVRGARQSAYGHPLDNHQRIADFWTTRLGDKLRPGVTIEPHEAAAMMRLVKEARLMKTVGHQDSLDDIAGYTDVEHEIHRERRRRAADADELIERLHAENPTRFEAEVRPLLDAA